MTSGEAIVCDDVDTIVCCYAPGATASWTGSNPGPD